MKVRVYTDYNPIKVVRAFDKANLSVVSEKCGLTGNFVEVDETEIPSDRSYRNAWKVDKGSIVEDEAKVAVINEAIAQKEADVLVAEKVKELAIAELKVEGKLDADGKVTK